MTDDACTCATAPDGTHYPACPSNPYQAGIRSGRSQERAAIVARNSCACACAKCINVRARMILDDDAVADSPKPLRPGK